MRWLAYAHPVAMVAVLALGIWVFREGLRVRRARLEQRRFDSRLHRRLARLFVGLALLGYAAGLASMAWLRADPAASSLHFLIVSGALFAMLTAGALGLRLERRAALPVRRVHAISGALGLLLALAAAVAGIAILP